jgi:HD domain
VRILYRASQLWRTLFTKTDHSKLEQALVVLSQEQKAQFYRMQPGEQNHAVIIYQRLLEQGETQPDLLVAGLLHDVGKLRYPMSSLERAMVVVVKVLLPRQAHSWGQHRSSEWDNLPSWRKAFIVTEHHAAWGAEIARQAGVSHLAENLIRQHDRPHSQGADSEETILLQKLWLVDNES